MVSDATIQLLYVTLLVVITLSQTSVTSHQLELDFLFQRQNCASVSPQLDELFLCQPDKFVSVSSCGSDRAVLHCPANRYIVVYTAEWQRTDNLPGLPTCDSQPLITDGGVDGCSRWSCVMGIISTVCHARRRCAFLVGVAEDTGHVTVPPYCLHGDQSQHRLLVTYACLHKMVLKDINSDGRVQQPTFCPFTTPDMTSQTRDVIHPTPTVNSTLLFAHHVMMTSSTTSSLLHNDHVDDYINIEESVNEFKQSVMTLSSRPHTSTQGIVVLPASRRHDNSDVINWELIADWLWTIQFVYNNTEKCFVYSMFGVSVGIIVLLTFAFMALYMRCRRRRHNNDVIAAPDPPKQPEVDSIASSRPTPSPSLKTGEWSSLRRSDRVSGHLEVIDRTPVCSDRSLTHDVNIYDVHRRHSNIMTSHPPMTSSEYDVDNGQRHPPSGVSSFSANEMTSSTSDYGVNSPNTTPPPPPPHQQATSTVIARYWFPPDGQASHRLPVSETLPGGNINAYTMQGSSKPLQPAPKAVHFDTYRASVYTRDLPEDERQGTPPLTNTVEGHSLPSAHCHRGSPVAAHCRSSSEVLATTPTATINRHYTVQSRPIYRGTSLDSPSTPPAASATLYRNVSGAPRPHEAPHSLGVHCTMSDGGCETVAPEVSARLRHYCV